MSDEKNQQLKETFDYIKEILGNIEDLFKAMLIRINLMLIEIKETNVNKEIVIPYLHEKIKNDEVDDCMQKLYETFQEFLN